MIISFFLENMKNGKEYQFNNKKYLMEIKKTRNTFFNKCIFEVEIIVEIQKDEYNDFKNYADQIIEQLENIQIRYRKIAVSAIWYVFSNDANENDFKIINDNNNYRRMNNVITLVNCKTWEIFFKPEDIANRVLTKRMVFLREQQSLDEQAIKRARKIFCVKRCIS